MRYIRPRSPLDDLIGGLIQDTRRDMSDRSDLMLEDRLYNTVFRSAAAALVHELRRPSPVLADFIAGRTNFGDRKDRCPYENYWAVQVTEGVLAEVSLGDDYNWPRALGYAHQAVVESVFAELREEGIL